MLKYQAQIKCDHCGVTFTTVAHTKDGLLNIATLQSFAKEKGWTIKEKGTAMSAGRHLCPACNYRWGDDE